MARRDPLTNYIDDNKEEIVNWIQERLTDRIEDREDAYTSLARKVAERYPYGPGLDNQHLFLTNAIIYSLWSGWFSQARNLERDPSFGSEEVERFRNMISEAFSIGKRYATERH